MDSGSIPDASIKGDNMIVVLCILNLLLSIFGLLLMKSVFQLQEKQQELWDRSITMWAVLSARILSNEEMDDAYRKCKDASRRRRQDK